MTYGVFPHIRAPYSYDREDQASSYSSRYRGGRRHRRPEVEKRPMIQEIFASGEKPGGASRPDVITMPNKNSGDNVSLLDTKTFQQEQSTAFPFYEEPEIVEDENGTEINLDLPGVKSEDLKVELDDTIMIINGMRRASDGKWKAFERSFQLDAFAIDTESIKANLLDGVLTITIEKKESGRALNVEVTTYEEGEEEALVKKKEEEEEAKKKREEKKARLRRMNRSLKAQQNKREDSLGSLTSAQKALLPKPGESVSLLIEILSAKHLLRADRIGNRGKGKSDPYVRAILGDEILHETKYITQTLNPVFKSKHNNVFVYNGKAEDLLDAQGISFFILDFDMGQDDDPLGDVFVGVEDLLLTSADGDVAEFDITPPQHRMKEDAGSIQIRIAHTTEAERKKHGKPARRHTTFWKPPKNYDAASVAASRTDSKDNSRRSVTRSILSKSVKSSRSRGSSIRGSMAKSLKHKSDDFC
mmetsp:Transcript_7138/g.10409  ORF Transcript_7138/g.10409 Transcript_7138/m.10409 type:complete len:473 (-) Transcript_7138:126-1544(-)